MVQAKAHLRLLERRQAPKHEIETAKARLAALQNYSPSTEPKPEPVIVVERPRANAPIPVDQLPETVRRRIDELTLERDGIHAKKVTLSNSLHTYDDDTNCRDVVKAILALRDDWKARQDSIRVLLQTGVLPEEPAQPTSRELPDDPEKIRYQIQCLQSNINKAEKRSRDAKNDSTRQRNTVMVARWQVEIEQLKTKLSGMK